MILILLYGKFPVRIWIRSHLLKPEVGNVTSKCNGVTRYRFNHVLREITIKGDNISYEPRATAFRSGNEPREKTIKRNNFLHGVEALCDNAKMQCCGSASASASA
jgi:hypothetical protein